MRRSCPAATTAATCRRRPNGPCTPPPCPMPTTAPPKPSSPVPPRWPPAAGPRPSHGRSRALQILPLQGAYKARLPEAMGYADRMLGHAARGLGLTHADWWEVPRRHADFDAMELG